MKKHIIVLMFFVIIFAFSNASISFATSISLDMDLLPSSKGWTYLSENLLEADTFSLNGGVLSMNTLGSPFGAGSGYGYDYAMNIEPFTLSVRARVLQEEIFAHGPAQGLQFNVYVNDHCYNFALGPNDIRIQADGLGGITFASFDNTQFHDYILQGTPGSGNSYTLSIDGTIIMNGIAESRTASYSLIFGDLSSNGNGLAEIDSISFNQGTPVPEPSTIFLFCISALILFGYKRLQLWKEIR